jgi:hypothetical protein
MVQPGCQLACLALDLPLSKLGYGGGIKMRFSNFCALAFVVLASAAYAAPEKEGSTTEEQLNLLDDIATNRLKLDLGKIERRGAEKNMAGIRSQYILVSKRLDSRTYFIQDDRYQGDEGSGIFQGSDEECIRLSDQVLRELAIPTKEIAKSVVMTEKLQTARYDPENKRYTPGQVRSGKRFVEVSRMVDGVPVFSSRALIGLARDQSVGFLDVHWPQFSETTVREAQRLQDLVQKGWRPPAQRGAVVESVEAGIIHSPALGFAMDIHRDSRDLRA